MISVDKLSCLGSGYGADCCTGWRCLLGIQCASHPIYRPLGRNCFPSISWGSVLKMSNWAAEKGVSLLGSNLLLYLVSSSKYFMDFISYQRHIPHLYCQRLILDCSSAPEGHVMDFLPGSKTLRSLHRKNGVRRFLSIPTSLLDTQKAEPASAYLFCHGVHFIAFS